MSYKFADSLRAGSGRNEFHPDPDSKNKFEKLVHLVGFIIRICHDARSSERQNRRTWSCIRSVEYFNPRGVWQMNFGQ
jgi:hypothetical protein